MKSGKPQIWKSKSGHYLPQSPYPSAECGSLTVSLVPRVNVKSITQHPCSGVYDSGFRVSGLEFRVPSLVFWFWFRNYALGISVQGSGLRAQGMRLSAWV